MDIPGRSALFFFFFLKGKGGGVDMRRGNLSGETARSNGRGSFDQDAIYERRIKV